MTKRKYTSIRFHTEAQAIVNNHFGEIPDFRLQTAAKIETKNGDSKHRFWIIYEYESYGVCDFEFCIVEDSPTLALRIFEERIKIVFEIPIPEEIKLPIEFYI